MLKIDLNQNTNYDSMKYQGYSLIKYCSTNLFPVYLREKISLKKYIRNNLSQTFIRCTFWYLKSWRNTKRKFLLQNGMSMAITVLILCVPWYQVNKNSQTNTNCMYIHSYEDLIIWYNDKTFFLLTATGVVFGGFPCDYLTNPGQQTCVYYVVWPSK